MIAWRKVPRRQLLAGASPAWFVVTALFAAAIAGGYLANRWAGTDFTPCLLRNLTGIPCPFCGGTRSFFSLLSGDVLAALHWNPLLTAAVAILPLWASAWMLTGHQLALRCPPRVLQPVLLALLLLNWLHVLRVHAGLAA